VLDARRVYHPLWLGVVSVQGKVLSLRGV
jgi:hypothetical protein